MTVTDLRDYVDTMFGGEDDQLRTFRETAQAEGLPLIQVPNELARLLQVLIVQSRAKTILEIGTLFGYSSVVMGRVLPVDGHITSLEIDARHASLARSNLKAAGLEDRVRVRQGAAIDTLSALGGRDFDFVFIDADKANYPIYLQHALALTHVGSTIVADNVWRQGEVVSPAADAADVRGLAAFNLAIASNRRLLTAVVGTRNGDDAASISVVVD